MSMTVAELIDKLRAMPQDMRVVVDGYEGDVDEPVVTEEWVIFDRGFDGQHFQIRGAAKYLLESRAGERQNLVILIGRG